MHFFLLAILFVGELASAQGIKDCRIHLRERGIPVPEIHANQPSWETLKELIATELELKRKVEKLKRFNDVTVAAALKHLFHNARYVDFPEFLESSEDLFLRFMTERFRSDKGERLVFIAIDPERESSEYWLYKMIEVWWSATGKGQLPPVSFVSTSNQSELDELMKGLEDDPLLLARTHFVQFDDGTFSGTNAVNAFKPLLERLLLLPGVTATHVKVAFIVGYATPTGQNVLKDLTESAGWETRTHTPLTYAIDGWVPGYSIRPVPEFGAIVAQAPNPEIASFLRSRFQTESGDEQASRAVFSFAHKLASGETSVLVDPLHLTSNGDGASSKPQVFWERWVPQSLLLPPPYKGSWEPALSH